jgi:hypothetical protein
VERPQSTTERFVLGYGVLAWILIESGDKKLEGLKRVEVSEDPCRRALTLKAPVGDRFVTSTFELPDHVGELSEYADLFRATVNSLNDSPNFALEVAHKASYEMFERAYYEIAGRLILAGARQVYPNDVAMTPSSDGLSITISATDRNGVHLSEVVEFPEPLESFRRTETWSRQKASGAPR